MISYRSLSSYFELYQCVSPTDFSIGWCTSRSYRHTSYFIHAQLTYHSNKWHTTGTFPFALNYHCATYHSNRWYATDTYPLTSKCINMYLTIQIYGMLRVRNHILITMSICILPFERMTCYRYLSPIHSLLTMSISFSPFKRTTYYRYILTHFLPNTCSSYHSNG